MINLKSKVLAASIFLLLSICSRVFAQQDNKLVALTKQVIESRVDADIYAGFVRLKELYFQDHRYTDFVEFLDSLRKQKKELGPFVNYYIALSRYQQLKYLEGEQGWDEYFSQGNSYRDQISSGLEGAISLSSPKEKLFLYAKLLLWKFHQDQQDAFAQEALSGLMEATSEYQKDALDFSPLKEVADELIAYGERGKAKELYLLYVNKLVSFGQVKDEELKNIALGFYRENNLELSQLVYDIYIEKVLKVYPKEKALPLMIEIAREFSYKEDGLADLSYAEKLFQKIEEIGGKEAFNEELIHLRAFNLEKNKEYEKAKDLYQYLAQQYLSGAFYDEAGFKAGIIYTYILRDIANGRNYFTKLSQKVIPSPQSISSLYQLGLLAQWENDLIKAKGYYDALLVAAGDNFLETVALAKERLKELAEVKPIEYNLRTFMDVCLRPENAIFDAGRLDLSAYPYRSKIEQGIDVKSVAVGLETGCMEVEVQYLWSGHLGTAKPSFEQSAFNTTYIHSGTKEINLVAVSPSGVIARDIYMEDVD
jgi:hypothetical protein